MTKSHTNGSIAQMSKKTRKTVKQYAPMILDESTPPSRFMRRLSPRLRELVSMLEYARPAGSATEEAFIVRYIDTLPNVARDTYGNRIVTVGKQRPTIAYSCHTDTVHYEEGKQALCIDEAGLLALAPHSAASCLGADCTAGVWLMRRMILAGKPGLYIFHREEEIGCKGSKHLVKHTPELVDGITAMIALDRRGYDSVVTEQVTGVTASNRFATSLAAQLGGAYRPDDGGIYTDSAYYAGVIPECTNVSVGYHDQHGTSETLDHVFLDALLLTLLRLDYSGLEISRQPQEPKARDYYYYSSAYGAWADRYYDYMAGEACSDYTQPYVDRELVDMIRKHPEAVARLMRQWDLTEGDLYEAIREQEDEEDIKYR